MDRLGEEFSMHRDGRRLEVHDLERNDQDSTTWRLLLTSKDSGMRFFETLLHGWLKPKDGRTTDGWTRRKEEAFCSFFAW